MALVSVFLVFLGALSSVGFPSVSASTCPKESYFFPYNLQFQCPLSISANPVLKVDGNFLDKFLTSMQGNACTSVLFYASWCPFSSHLRPKFELLSSMFPQIGHLAVEQSSALPSIFSRYGIHSLPSVIIVNQMSKVPYYGPKNLQSLVQFYEITTGLEPVQHLVEDEPSNLGGHEDSILQLWDGSPLDQIIKRELCLVLATLFLCLRLLLFASPKLLSHLKAFWGSYVPHFNLEIFGGTSQLFECILQMVDVRRIWTKLTLSKTRTFHERAKNCSVWASSLASVSLGKSSSSARS
uniref:Thioredoxin domain-containing protein n=1 Tax=Rhizophora mucronata TaxID=61149 RepID=A0A2P2KBD3_RHIMU